MSTANRKRGQAVEHSYVTPVEIEEGGRLINLDRSLDDLILYIRKISGKGNELKHFNENYALNRFLGYRGCCGFILAVGIFIPLSMVIMGIYYYENCPGQKNITRYLLVGGLATLLQITIRCLTKKFRSFLTLISLFSLAWFIAGSVWIFSLYKPNQEKSEAKDYCNEQLYLYAFWMTLVQYILSTFVIVYMCIMCYLSIETV